MIFPNARIRRFKLYKTFLLLIVFLFVIVLSILFSFFCGTGFLYHASKKNKSVSTVFLYYQSKKYICWCKFLVPCNYIIAKHLSFCKHCFNAFSLILKAFLTFGEHKKKRGYSSRIPSIFSKYFYPFYL